MKHARKIFVEDGIYHVYNRGVNRDKIFFSGQDYKNFLILVEKYLTKSNNIEPHRRKNYATRIKLMCFCLVDNHYHFLLKQKDSKAMTQFMHGLSTSYTNVTNFRNNRVGSLFQGIYKARLILSNEDLMNVSRYIHLNPRDIDKDPFKYYYSSISSYLGQNKWDFVDESIVLGLFNDYSKSYEAFLRAELD